MKTHLLYVAAATAFLTGAALPACAQSIDYGSLEQLFNEPVTTSATGTPQRVTDAPVDMSIITAEDITRSGATDLPTILSRVAGIDILNESAGTADLGVRGYNTPYSPRLLVLINGRQVYLDDYGYTNWAGLPVTLSEIRQIEVVRGPNSALFGFNAVGGVINIITYDPQFDAVNTAEVHGGTQSDGGGSLVSTFHLGDRVFLRLSGGGERQNEWKNSTQDGNPWNSHGEFDLEGQIDPQTIVRVEGTWARNAEADVLGGNNLYAWNVYTTTSLKGSVASDTKIGAVTAQAYVNNLSNDVVTDSSILKTETIVTSLQDLVKLDAKSTLRVEVDYRNNRMRTGPIGGGYLDYGVWAPSAMWGYQATQKLALTAAVRLDDLQLSRTGAFPAYVPLANNSFWRRSIDAVSANVGAVYKATDLDTLRATFARGVQAPSLLSLGGLQVTFPGLFIGGNPALNPTVVSNYELAYDRNLTQLNAKVSAKIFYQQNQPLVAPLTVAAPAFAPTATSYAGVVPVQRGGSDMTGFELSASGTVAGGFRWNADTTYTNVWDILPSAYNSALHQVDYTATTPKFRGNVAVGWSNAVWSADVYVHYVSAFQTYDPIALATTAGYATVAARVSHDFGNGLIAAVSGQNLAAGRQIQAQASGLQAERRVLLTLTKGW